MFLEGPENALITKLMRNALVMEVLANWSISVVAAPGLMMNNTVREPGSLLPVGTAEV